MASTSSLTLPLSTDNVFTTQTLLAVGGVYLLYLVVRMVYALFIYPFYVSPLRHLPTPKVRRSALNRSEVERASAAHQDRTGR